MKKFITVFILAAIITTGTAFADHPDGFGIGAEFGGATVWDGWGFGANAALSLKIPNIPIYWAVGTEFTIGKSGGGFYLGVSGDYYFIDMPLVGDLLHWYVGAGAQIGIGIGAGGGGAGLALNALARIPVGLSVQFPVSSLVLELYVQVVPSIGLHILPTFRIPAGGFGGALGFRVWF